MMLAWKNSPIGLQCDQWDETLDGREDEFGLLPVRGRGVGVKISLFGGRGRQPGWERGEGGWSGGATTIRTENKTSDNHPVIYTSQVPPPPSHGDAQH